MKRSELKQIIKSVIEESKRPLVQEGKNGPVHLTTDGDEKLSFLFKKDDAGEDVLFLALDGDYVSKWGIYPGETNNDSIKKLIDALETLI